MGPYVFHGYGSITSAPTNTIYGTRDPALVEMWRTIYQTLKQHSSLRRRVITGGSKKDARVSWRTDYQIDVIEFYVSVNNKKWHVAWIMCHACRFICYLCVELKLNINTRSRSIQALKSAHLSLLSSRRWPWGVFSSCLASRDLGTAPTSYLARVGPMVLLRENNKTLH